MTRIQKITEDEIRFDNGVELSYYHQQNCCEDVAPDFEYLLQYNIIPSTGEKCCIYDIEFNDDIYNHIILEKDMGFKLEDKNGNRWFVPCHNYQNGYYNDNLELIIKFSIDITDCTIEGDR